MNKRKINLSTFLIMLIILLGIIVFFAFAVLNAYDAVAPKDERIAELEKSVSDLKRELELEKFILGIDDEQVGENTTQDNTANNEDVQNYKNEIDKLKQEIVGYKTKLQDFEKDVVGEENFKIGIYVYSYDVVTIGSDGEESIPKPFTLCFDFEEDKKVSANLVGEESGCYNGTYEIFKDVVKCTFTEIDNESGGVTDQKLENAIVVVLKRVNDMQLSFLTQDEKTSSKDFGIKDSEIRLYTYTPDTVKQ